MARIFVCYRRDDSSGHAGRLHDRLVSEFGRENVFLDVDTLAPGVNFRKEIRATLSRIEVMLVVIGRHWIDARDSSGRRRLDNPDDHVRVEIAAALAKDILVIPVLVGAASAPRGDTLPDDIRELADRNAIELNDRDWHHDTSTLVETLKKPISSLGREGPINRPVNLGFDGPVEEGLPHGWFNSVGYVSYASDRYEIRTMRRQGGACLRLSRNEAALDEFGSLMQRFPAAFLAGRTVRLDGELKTENVTGWAGLWIRADGEQVPNLVFDNMHNRGPRGSQEWSRYSLEVNLPQETRWLNIGIVLNGPGTLWADDLHLRVWNSDGHWADV